MSYVVLPDGTIEVISSTTGIDKAKLEALQENARNFVQDNRGR